MKRNIFLYALAALTLTVTGSCNDWLEVPVDGQSTSKELFETGDGYRAALNGLYQEMADPKLYGRELQFGVIDFFSNQYKTNVSQTELNSPVYIAAGKRNFKDKDLQPVLDDIWLSAYNVIAASNDILQNIQNETDDKFSSGEMEKKLIIGEVKAIRAFLHFDMLRLYAPAPIQDDGAAYIPYVESFPNTHAQRISVKEVLAKVIADLEEARALVKPYDDSPLGQSANVSGNARYYNELTYGMEGYANQEQLDKFFFGRGYRFSYWAITGLLARVYQYNASYVASDLDKAKACVEEVLNYAVTNANNSVFTPFKEENFEFKWEDSPEAMKGLRMTSTLLMAVYNEKEQDKAALEHYFPRTKPIEASSLIIIDREGQDIFKTVDGIDESSKDLRATHLNYMLNGGYNTYMSTKWYVKESDKDERDKTLRILPLIRTTELRYILAEYYAEKGNFTEAYNIINQMRRNRSLDTELSVKQTKDGFLKDLVREAQREWISEGQLFYLYKRLGANVKRTDGTSSPFKKEECVVPIPAGEII